MDSLSTTHSAHHSKTKAASTTQMQALPLSATTGGKINGLHSDNMNIEENGVASERERKDFDEESDGVGVGNGTSMQEEREISCDSVDDGLATASNGKQENHSSFVLGAAPSREDDNDEEQKRQLANAIEAASTDNENESEDTNPQMTLDLATNTATISPAASQVSVSPMTNCSFSSSSSSQTMLQSPSEEDKAKKELSDTRDDKRKLTDAITANSETQPRKRHQLTSSVFRSASSSPLPSASSSSSSSSSSASQSQQRSSFVSDGVIPELWHPHRVSVYHQDQKIGEGTYGHVHSAISAGTHDRVALKQLKKEKKEGFPITALREIKLLTSLHHPNIIDVTDVCSSYMDSKRNCEGDVYMVFPFMDHDLQGIIDFKSPLAQPLIKYFMINILRGLEYLHEKRIIHRDIKAGNVLVTNSGEVRIGDFGLARYLPSPDLSQSDRQLTSKVVTLWYRAPELLLGSQNYDCSIDMWSLGCLFAELLSNDLPFGPNSKDMDQLNAIFDICGTPSVDDWPQVSQLKIFSEIQPKPRQRRLKEEFRRRLPFITDHALSLLDGLLTLNPCKRLTATQALHHEYFEKDLPRASFEHSPWEKNLFEMHSQERRKQKLELKHKYNHQTAAAATTTNLANSSNYNHSHSHSAYYHSTATASSSALSSTAYGGNGRDVVRDAFAPSDYAHGHRGGSSQSQTSYPGSSAGSGPHTHVRRPPRFGPPQQSHQSHTQHSWQPTQQQQQTSSSNPQAYSYQHQQQQQAYSQPVYHSGPSASSTSSAAPPSHGRTHTLHRSGDREQHITSASTSTSASSSASSSASASTSYRARSDRANDREAHRHSGSGSGSESAKNPSSHPPTINIVPHHQRKPPQR